MDTRACLAGPPGTGVGLFSAVLVHNLLANAPTMEGTGTSEDTSIMTPADEATFIELWQ
jgi:hypothetical protein